MIMLHSCCMLPFQMSAEFSKMSQSLVAVSRDNKLFLYQQHVESRSQPSFATSYLSWLIRHPSVCQMSRKNFPATGLRPFDLNLNALISISNLHLPRSNNNVFKFHLAINWKMIHLLKRTFGSTEKTQRNI